MVLAEGDPQLQVERDNALTRLQQCVDAQAASGLQPNGVEAVPVETQDESTGHLNPTTHAMTPPTDTQLNNEFRLCSVLHPHDHYPVEDVPKIGN